MTDYRSAVLATDDGALIRVRVVPGATGSAVAGLHGDMVKVRISAPPVDGKANAELGKVVAAATGVRPRDVHVVRGERSRTKVVRVDRLTSTEVAARLAAAEGRDVATLRTR